MSKVFVSLIRNAEFGIDEQNDMFFGRENEPGSRVYVGKADALQLDNLIENMNRLRHQMTDIRLAEDRP